MFTTCDARVNTDADAEAIEYILTFERSPKRVALLLAAHSGEAGTVGFRDSGVIGLATGWYEDRRSMTFVDKPWRHPSTGMDTSPHNEVPRNEEIYYGRATGIISAKASNHEFRFRTFRRASHHALTGLPAYYTLWGLKTGYQ